MRERVAALLEGANLILDAERVHLSLLLRAPAAARWRPRWLRFVPASRRSFTIYDDEDQLAIVKAAFRHLGLDEKFMQYRAALSRHQPCQEHEADAAGFL